MGRKSAAARAGWLPGDAVQALADFLAVGGKRLRPLLCVTGWHTTSPPRRMIRIRHLQAHHTLDQAPFPPAVTAVLRQMADAATTRTS
ncbi:hypothetical protein GCM10010245_88010 [Streptomyces spectabilis]|nr:hypothetical protein GCM10010245_88010 [Streptomyces spectabilis]